MSNRPVFESKLHKYAFLGKKIKLKTWIKNEKVSIDSLDSEGNTALYYACMNGHKGCVKILLENSANPNERCMNGLTPVHAAAFSCNIKIMSLLLEYGGDLRLHDNDNRAPKDLVMFQTNTNLRRSMIVFIEEARHKAKIQTKKATDVSAETNKPRRFSLADSFNFKSSAKASDKLVNSCSVGFGTLYKTPNEVGVPVVLPVINESDLLHDSMGPTLRNGAFMAYESMRWKDVHLVTIKRLSCNAIEGGCVDLLIEELKFLRRINHFPKILSVMGFCQIENADGMVLMFERINVGSLFNILHEIKLTKMPKLRSITDIMLNICEALIYLHEQNILHCYVNSHSVFLTSSHTAKLGNLEYAVDKSAEQKKSKITENHYVNCAWNWLAPEMMSDQPPNEMSDMYSFCAVLWELFNLAVPWQDMDYDQIRNEMINEGKTLPVDFDMIPLPFSRIILDGFQMEPITRMSFEDVKFHLESFHHNLPTNIPLINNNNKPKSKNLQSRPSQHSTTGIQQTHKRTLSDQHDIAVNNYISNSNEMAATLNSNEDLDSKFSQLSRTYSYICCDAYKTEIHLTRGSKKLSSSLSQLNDLATLNTNNNISTHSKSKHKMNRSASLNRNQTRSNINEYYKQTFDLNNNVNSKKSPMQPNKASNSKKSQKKPPLPPLSSMPTPPPAPPPPPPPPPQPQQHPAPSKASSTLPKPPSSQSTAQPQKKKKNVPQSSQVIPSLPPPPLPPPPPPQCNQKSTLNTELPLPPSFLLTPQSPPNKQHMRASRSVDSPRTINDNQQLPHTPVTKKTELFEMFSERINKKNDEIRSTIQMNQQNSNNNNNSSQLEANLAMLKREKFNILESIYYNNPNLLKPENREKMFTAIQRHLEAKNKQLLEASNNNEQQQQQANKINDSDKCSKQLNTNNKIEYLKATNNNLATQNPTPDDKKRYFMSNKINYDNDDDQNKIISPHLSKKLDMSTISQEDNTLETPARNLRKNRSTTAVTNKSSIGRSSSHTSIASDGNIRIRNNLDLNLKSNMLRNHVGSLIQQNQHLNTALPPDTDSTSRNNMQSEYFAGLGSVKNLVQSYEEFPNKEKSESNLKVQMLREERNKELSHLVEHTKNSNNQHINEEINKIVINNINSQVNEQLDTQQQQQVQRQGSNISTIQSKLQKELSTISERTEHSNSFNNGLNASGIVKATQSGLKTHANSNNNTQSFLANNTTGEVNAINANASRTTLTNNNNNTITKSIRHLDQKYFLDSSATGASGDIVSIRNSTISNISPIQAPLGANNYNLNNTNTNYSSNNNSYANTTTKSTSTMTTRQQQQNLIDLINQHTGGSGIGLDFFDISNGSCETTNTTTAINNKLNNQQTTTTASVSKTKYTNEAPLQKVGSNQLMSSTASASLNRVSSLENYYNINKKFISNQEENDDNNDSDEDSDHDEDGDDDTDDDDYENNNEGRQGRKQNKSIDNVNDHSYENFKYLSKQLSSKNVNKSHYSSQEDMLSSLQGEESSIECSEGVYLEDFNKIISKQESNKHQRQTVAYFAQKFEAKGATYKNTYDKMMYRGTDQQDQQNLVNTYDELNSMPSFPPPPPVDFDDEHLRYANEASGGGIVAASLNEATSSVHKQHLSPTSGKTSKKTQTAKHHDVNIYENVYKSTCTRKHSPTPSASSSCRPDASSTSSNHSHESTSNETANDEERAAMKNMRQQRKHVKQSSESAKLTNVRLDKHVIDTTKFKGYSYKLETRSNVTNQYHIKSLLTNEQTGHSLLLANTRVQTPNIQTKVIIDQ